MPGTQLYILSQVLTTTVPQNVSCPGPVLLNGETETQRGEVTCTRAHSRSGCAGICEPNFALFSVFIGGGGKVWNPNLRLLSWVPGVLLLQWTGQPLVGIVGGAVPISDLTHLPRQPLYHPSLQLPLQGDPGREEASASPCCPQSAQELWESLPFLGLGPGQVGRARREVGRWRDGAVAALILHCEARASQPLFLKDTQGGQTGAVLGAGHSESSHPYNKGAPPAPKSTPAPRM